MKEHIDKISKVLNALGADPENCVILCLDGEGEHAILTLQQSLSCCHFGGITLLHGP